MYGLRGPSGLNMVNQAFIIVIAYRPRFKKEKKEEKEEKKKIPGIGRYPMGPTKMQLALLPFKNNPLAPHPLHFQWEIFVRI